MTSAGCGPGARSSKSFRALRRAGSNQSGDSAALKYADTIPDLMNKRTKDIVIAVVAIGVAVVSLYFAFGRRSQKINLDAYDVLGAVTAEETARLIGNKGQVLLMIPDTGANKNPSVEAEVKTFQQTLKKEKGINVIVEKIPVTPMLMMATGGGVPPEQFFKVLEKHGNVSGLVLFFSFPDLTDTQVESLKKYGAKTVVVSSFRQGYKRFLEQGGLHLVIAPRLDTPPATAQTPRTIRERFDQDFSIITPEEARRSL